MRQSFEIVLDRMINKARQNGLLSIDINAGEIHRSAGHYPGVNHRMPVCCAVMRSRMQSEDHIIYAPPKGNGARLTVRYRINSSMKTQE